MRNHALRLPRPRCVSSRSGRQIRCMVRSRRTWCEYCDRTGWLNRVTTDDAAVHALIVARLSLRREALAAARAELLRLHRAGDIGDDALNALEQELDLEELYLQQVAVRERRE